jgi:hypothetical protein
MIEVTGAEEENNESQIKTKVYGNGFNWLKTVKWWVFASTVMNHRKP